MAGQGEGAQDGGGRELPSWVYLWIPILSCALVFAVAIVDEGFYDRWIETEQGVLENATAAIPVVAIVFGALALRRRRLLPKTWLSYWIIIVCAGCLYITGEELSWGQRLFGWETPELFKRLSNQGETNLHNISSWLDQKPRALLEIAVIVGGFGFPLWMRARRVRWNPAHDWRGWIVPTWVCFPTAVLAFLVRMPERAAEFMNWNLGAGPVVRYSELQEYCFALFLLLYLLSIHRRLIRAERRG